MTKQDLVSDIYGEESEEVVVEQSPKKIETLEDATRYAYGLSETRKEIDKLKEIAQVEIDKWQGKINQVQEWLEGVVSPLEEKETYLSHLLLAYHTDQYNNAPNEKTRKKLNSIKLPYDITLKSRVQQPKLEVVDEVTYTTYAETNNLMKEPKEPEVNWAALKKQLDVTDEGHVINKETGEVLTFIKATPQERKFEVK